MSVCKFAKTADNCSGVGDGNGGWKSELVTGLRYLCTVLHPSAACKCDRSTCSQLKSVFSRSMDKCKARPGRIGRSITFSSTSGPLHVPRSCTSRRPVHKVIDTTYTPLHTYKSRGSMHDGGAGENPGLLMQPNQCPTLMAD